MSEVVDAVRTALPAGCETNSCSEQSCSLTLRGIDGDRVLVDMNALDLSAMGNVERCDRLFVGQGAFVAPIELKRGDIRAQPKYSSN